MSRSLSNGICAIVIGIFSRVDLSLKRERQKRTFRLVWRTEFYDGAKVANQYGLAELGPPKRHNAWRAEFYDAAKVANQYGLAELGPPMRPGRPRSTSPATAIHVNLCDLALTGF